MQLFKDLKPFYDNRGGALKSDYRGDFALLEDAGFGWILVSYRKGAERMPQGMVDAMNQICGSAFVRGPGLGAWKLPKVQYTDVELTAWKVAHEKAVAQTARMSPGMGRPLD